MNKVNRIGFIINPKAGQRKRKDLDNVIYKEIDNNRWEPVIMYTRYPGHSKELIKRGVEDGINYFVAIGGDGTVNEVFSEALNYDITVGVIPCGSGNGLARALKIPVNFRKALKGLNSYATSKIDVGILNGHHFFCTSGCGFDAWIGHKFDVEGKRGLFTYIKVTFREIIKYKTASYKLNIDGVDKKFDAFILTIANANQYGNNAYISPLSELNDGKLEVCVVRPFPILMAPVLAYRLFKKTIHKSKYVRIFQAGKIWFSEEKKYVFHIDGEPLLIQGDVKIDLLTCGLKVLAPNN